MRKTYIFLSAIFLGIAAIFGYLAIIFTNTFVMTPEEYARQAQEIVCDQAAGGRCSVSGGMNDNLL